MPRTSTSPPASCRAATSAHALDAVHHHDAVRAVWHRSSGQDASGRAIRYRALERTARRRLPNDAERPAGVGGAHRITIDGAGWKRWKRSVGGQVLSEHAADAV